MLKVKVSAGMGNACLQNPALFTDVYVVYIFIGSLIILQKVKYY